jgi:hypothetical protein
LEEGYAIENAQKRERTFRSFPERIVYNPERNTGRKKRDGKEERMEEREEEEGTGTRNKNEKVARIRTRTRVQSQARALHSSGTLSTTAQRSFHAFHPTFSIHTTNTHT